MAFTYTTILVLCILHFINWFLQFQNFSLVLLWFLFLLNFLVCVFFFLISLNCLFSCSSFSSLKQLFWITYQLDHKIPCIWTQSLKDFFDDMFFKFFVFLIVLHCCFLIWSSRYLRSLQIVFRWGILLSGLLSDLVCIYLLSTSYFCLWQNSYAFMFSLVLTTHWMALFCFPISTPFTGLTATFESVHRSTTNWEGVWVALAVLRCHWSKWGDPWLRSAQRLMSRIPAEILSAVSRRCLFMPFDSLIYLFLNLLSSPVMAVSQQYSGCCWREIGFSSSIPYKWRIQAPIPLLFSYTRVSHWIVQPHAVAPWQMGGTGRVSFPLLLHLNLFL